eukprot:30623-Eustigmatos_ZCMA.PRE.1
MVSTSEHMFKASEMRSVLIPAALHLWYRHLRRSLCGAASSLDADQEKSQRGAGEMPWATR